MSSNERKDRPKLGQSAQDASNEEQSPLLDKHLAVPLKGVILLSIVLAYAPVSQMTLSPVYGSIPASLYHAWTTGLVRFPVLISRVLKPTHDSRDYTRWIPVLCFWIPTIQSVLFRQSSLLGPLWGPVVTEGLTYLPLLLLAALAFGPVLVYKDDSLHAVGTFRAGLAVVTPDTVNLIAVATLPRIVGSNQYLTRSGIQLLLAALCAAVSPSKLLLLALPSLVHSILYNVHMPFPNMLPRLNETLLDESTYIIRARQESLTGYISVLDNTRDGFRVMRCDHSLLGGEWLEPPQGAEHTPKVKEPIYAIFTMLEAVRLVQSDTQKTSADVTEDGQEQALVIGLGIGTSPSALIAHGINTTIVEIDPVVHQYASTYFSLPTNHNSVIEDAVTFVERAKRTTTRYNYIIHDVFTGGAEPVDLFTYEFMTGLHSLLREDGVIAINYAGDLLMPSARLVVRTIKAVFPTCRIFREVAGSSEADLERDFTNMVVFCTKSTKRLRFRFPTEEDFLDSLARQQHLLPAYEIDPRAFAGREGDGDVLRKDSTDRLEQWHQKSALGHWEIMRKVLPPVVWENW